MRFAIIAVLVSLGFACSDDGGTGTAGAPPATDPADARTARTEMDAAPPVEYPASKAGLAELGDDLVEALEDDDRERTRRLVESFELMDYRSWFTETFGDELGRQLAAGYEPAVGRFDQLLDTLDELVDDGHTEVAVERFQSTADDDAVVYQNLALEKMKEPTALYSLRLIREDAPDGEGTFHLWSFVHHGGSFRWIGKMKAVAGASAGASGGEDRKELRIREVEKLERIAQP